MFNVNPALYGSVFAVPSVLTDKYLKLASPAAIKVLLLILRNPGEDFTVEELSKRIGYCKADTLDAVEYWVSENVLVKNGTALTSETVEPGKPDDSGVNAQNKSEPMASCVAVPEKRPLPEIKIAKPTLEQISKRMEESGDVLRLMSESQSILGRTIGFDMQSTLLMLYDTYGLSVEVIFMLLEFCVHQSRSSTAYVAKLGKVWAEKEINTVELAADYIEKSTEAEKTFSVLRELTGMSTPRPTQKQTEYILSWRALGFEAPIIARAYDEMAERTGKISFNYMDKILLNWHTAGYKTPEDVENGERLFREKKQAVKQKGTSFSIDEAISDAGMGVVKYKKKGVK